MGRGDGQDNAGAVMEEDIWNNILQEATRTHINSLESRTLLILGDRNTGKSSLLARLQGLDISEANKGVAMTYNYIDIFEDENDDPVGRIDVWQLEGEVSNKDLLKFALNENTFANAMVLLALDFSQPWGLVESLRRWLAVLADHIATLKSKLPSGMEEALRHAVQSYQESPAAPAAGPRKKKKRPTADDQQVLPPLDPNVLTNNLGVPIIVACCKSDSVVMLEKDFDYKDGMFDYIQQHLRRICLSYGAALVYASARKDTNCELLMEYLEHRLFGFDIRHRCQLLEKDSLFVPAGWDSLQKITLDFENQNVCKDADELYENVIKKPNIIKRREQTQGVVISAEDDQEFLTRHKNVVDKDDDKKDSGGQQTGLLVTIKKLGGVIPSTAEESKNPSLPVMDVDDLDIPKRTGTPEAAATAAATAAPGGASAEKAVLANFFTSLMTSKPGASRNKLDVKSPSIPNFDANNNQLRMDAKKELDKLKRLAKK